MNRATSATGWVRNPDGTMGWTWNPFTGCLNHTNGLCNGGAFPCYAYKLANGRLKKSYLRQRVIGDRRDGSGWPWPDDLYADPSQEYQKAFNDPFYPRFWPEKLKGIPRGWETQAGRRRIRPRGIFVCDMSDLFGIGIPREWTQQVLDVIRVHPQHRFYVLTKQSQNLAQWIPFRDNCWVGVSATNTRMAVDAVVALGNVEATVKYLSLEPMLASINLPSQFLIDTEVEWIIIGALTGMKSELLELCQAWNISGTQNTGDLSLQQHGNKWSLQPKLEWVNEIVDAADNAGIRVFLKDNLRPIFDHPFYTRPYWAFRRNKLRQQVPME